MAHPSVKELECSHRGQTAPAPLISSIHPPCSPFSWLTLFLKTTALLRPSSTPTHPQKRIFHVLAEMCNRLRTSEDIFSPLEINPGGISSHRTPLSPVPSTLRQRWLNCLHTSGWGGYKNHYLLPFFLGHRSPAEIIWSSLQNQCSLLYGPVPSTEGAFLCLRQCYLCRVLVMAAWFFTGIWLVCIVLLKPPSLYLMLGAGIGGFTENFGGCIHSQPLDPFTAFGRLHTLHTLDKTYFIIEVITFLITGYEKGFMFICQEKQIIPEN